MHSKAIQCITGGSSRFLCKAMESKQSKAMVEQKATMVEQQQLNAKYRNEMQSNWWHCKARQVQSNAKLGNAQQSNTLHHRTKQCRAMQRKCKSMHNNAELGNRMQSNAKHRKRTHQYNASHGLPKQSNAMQSLTMKRKEIQGIAMRSNAKQCEGRKHRAKVMQCLANEVEGVARHSKAMQSNANTRQRKATLGKERLKTMWCVAGLCDTMQCKGSHRQGKQMQRFAMK